jgi:hypothetical protein
MTTMTAASAGDQQQSEIAANNTANERAVKWWWLRIDGNGTVIVGSQKRYDLATRVVEEAVETEPTGSEFLVPSTLAVATTEGVFAAAVDGRSRRCDRRHSLSLAIVEY